MRDRSDARGVIRLSRIGALIIVTAMVAAPIGAWAGHVFTDVPTDHVFHDDISAIAEVGVTRGCNPPANDRYCPEDNVTRGQMAAFLNRLGALSGGIPVVNAATLAGWSPDELVRVAWAAAPPEFSEDEDFPSGPAFMGIGTLLETSIEAPRDGFLIVTAHSETSNFTESDVAVCGIVLDHETLVFSSVGVTQHDQGVTDAEGRPLINELNFPGEEPVDGTGVNMEEDCVSHAVVPVRAGAHEVSFEALFAFPSTEWWNHSLSALYVPFDGQGNPPTDFEVVSADMDEVASMRDRILDRITR